jgi:hypothetical protein
MFNKKESMILGDYLELYVCVILTIEFWYDLIWNNREAQLKRRKNAKKEVDKQRLREGKSNSVQETKGAVCNMPEIPISVQEKIKP